MSLTPGVFYLLASVLCSVTVSVLLKLARRYDIDIRQAITVNYAVAAALCWLVFTPAPQQFMNNAMPWPVLVALGVLLPTVFLAMANSVRHSGIVRTDAAQRLSLFIPLMAAFLLFGDELTLRKAAAIALAFGALFCLLRRRPNAGAASGASPSSTTWIWPLAVWLGYGVIDIMFKQLARADTAFTGGLLVSFILAGLLLLAYLLWRRVRWVSSNILAGVLLGLVNFGNILTYVRAHQSLPKHPSLVFATMNMGVITLGALVGVVLFREPLNRLNLFGLGLAMVAIGLMIP